MESTRRTMLAGLLGSATVAGAAGATTTAAGNAPAKPAPAMPRDGGKIREHALEKFDGCIDAFRDDASTAELLLLSDIFDSTESFARGTRNFPGTLQAPLVQAIQVELFDAPMQEFIAVPETVPVHKIEVFIADLEKQEAIKSAGAKTVTQAELTDLIMREEQLRRDFRDMRNRIYHGAKVEEGRISADWQRKTWDDKIRFASIARNGLEITVQEA